MSITTELREYASSLAMRVGASTYEVKVALEEIADQIEEEVANYIPLPKDADGETIRIRDVMDGVNKYDPLKKVTGEVVAIGFSAMGESNVDTSIGLRVWAEDGSSYHTSYIDPYASIYRHHHEPTVEDVLREFVERWHDTHHDDIPALFAEYAAKLRLAGDAE